MGFDVAIDIIHGEAYALLKAGFILLSRKAFVDDVHFCSRLYAVVEGDEVPVLQCQGVGHGNRRTAAQYQP